MDQNRKLRIGNFMGGALLAVALLFDLMQFLVTLLAFIPVLPFIVTTFISLVSYITFGIWFALLGVDYFNGKKASAKVLTLLATLGLELVPLISALPVIFAGVITMIILSRMEDAADKKGAEFTTTLENKVAAQRTAIANAQNQQEIQRIQAESQAYATNLSNASYRGTSLAQAEQENEGAKKGDLNKKWLESYERRIGNLRSNVKGDVFSRDTRSVDIQKPSTPTKQPYV